MAQPIRIQLPGPNNHVVSDQQYSKQFPVSREKEFMPEYPAVSG
jgi:hypothetical protein